MLKDLIGQGYVVQKPGASDRRQRLLYCTESGAELAADLTRVQARRLAGRWPRRMPGARRRIF